MRHPLRVVIVVLALAAAATGVAIAEDEPATKPATRPNVRVTLPYSLLDDLTPGQEQEIIAVRTEILRQMRALRVQEKEQVMAVLTPQQRERLPELERERRREAVAEKKQAARDAD